MVNLSEYGSLESFMNTYKFSKTISMRARNSDHTEDLIRAWPYKTLETCKIIIHLNIMGWKFKT
jgi:hypothetical protein